LDGQKNTVRARCERGLKSEFLDPSTKKRGRGGGKWKRNGKTRGAIFTMSSGMPDVKTWQRVSLQKNAQAVGEHM
jgi:hypothetical protein